MTYEVITDSKGFTFCSSVKVKEPRDRPIFIFYSSFTICESINNNRLGKEQRTCKIYLEITNIRYFFF